MKTAEIPKAYYTISEVAERTGLKPHVLRYWETEFDVLRPRKNRAGNRAYAERDVRLVERIRQLLRDERYTIEGARQLLEREAADEAAGLTAEVGAAPPQAVAASTRVEAAEAEPWREDLVRLRAFLTELLRRLP